MLLTPSNMHVKRWASHMTRILQKRAHIGKGYHRCVHTSDPVSPKSKSAETELIGQLRARIRMNGPITIADYMREVLTNPSAGYYMHRDVFGTKGDFITSPEISQMFGELIGVWCVNEWIQKGSPSKIQLIEMGPGRGTLADDMLRVFSQLPGGIQDAVSVHMVEVSPHLSQMQYDKLAGKTSAETATLDTTGSESAKSLVEDTASRGQHYKTGTSRYGPDVFWYSQLADVPKGVSFFLAHEFFDALPIHKFQKKDGRWCEMLVDIDQSPDGEHHLRYVLSPGGTTATKLLLENTILPTDKRDHVEVCPEGGVLALEIAKRIEKDGGFALIADYGHTGEKTDTFRGFRDHALHEPLCEPGSADLTADVDFAYLSPLLQDQVAVSGPVTQESFLNNMGIGYRLQALMGNASPEQRKSLITGYDLLTNPAKMGERFKFMALHQRSQADYVPAGFKPLTES